MHPAARLLWLLPLALIVLCRSSAAQIQANDPATWVWNVPARPEIPGVAHHVLRSESMGLDVGYNVALPAGYEGGDARYPVIYFLHGRGGNENSDAGGFSSMVRGAVNAGTMPPAICVFPNGSLSFYLDDPERQVFGETLIVNELVPEVDRRYRTIAAGSGRALAGFSMGGAGAVRLAIKYPELFAAAGSWGGAVGTRYNPDLLRLTRENAAQLKERQVGLLLVIGADDMLADNQQLADLLQEVGVERDFRVLPGVAHNLGLYHQQTGETMLRFLGERLRRGAR